MKLITITFCLKNDAKDESSFQALIEKGYQNLSKTEEEVVLNITKLLEQFEKDGLITKVTWSDINTAVSLFDEIAERIFNKFYNNSEGLNKFDKSILRKHLPNLWNLRNEISLIQQNIDTYEEDLKLLTDNEDNTEYISNVKTEIINLKSKISDLNQYSLLREIILPAIISYYEDGLVGIASDERVEKVNKIDNLLIDIISNIPLPLYKKLISSIKDLENRHNSNQLQAGIDWDDYNHEELYFDAMTDGQLGDYDDFEDNSNDLDDWSGK